MDFNLYFDPVSIPRDQLRNVADNQQLSHKFTIHTPDFPIGKITDVDLAIIGVPEDRNAFRSGSATSPDLIRKKLYGLARFPQKVRIADLGNMKQGREINDTYKGLETILSYLLEQNVTPVILGGSQDLTFSLVRALADMMKNVQLVTIDPRLDLSKNDKQLLSDNYLTELIKTFGKKLNYVNLGHQEFLTASSDMKSLQNLGFESYRLGDVRANPSYFEPVFRDGNVLSIDFSAVRQNEAPGTSNPVPGGFTIDEICQLSKYAGLSAHMKVFSLFEIIPEQDREEQTMAVAAQTVWYFINGFIHRKAEDPAIGGNNFTDYIITLPDSDYRLMFRKSEETNRWWIKFPEEIKKKDKRTWIACTYEDYKTATQHEIPTRWLNLFRL